ncbi:MAG TPA: putative baseplate assembly protein, partial [Acidimicrobiales bacterium]|nr:putative baseplate assembly protein [Acidimicrobiales bacterium]
FVVVEVAAAVEWLAQDVVFLTAFAGAPPPGGPPLRAEDMPVPTGSSAGRHRWFEPPADGPAVLRFRPEHNTIRLHTWGDRECCLPEGATTASLVDEGLALGVGDLLVFEEVLGPRTGVPGDADPTRRHVVRLTKVADPVDDVVEKVFVRDVEWGQEDALPFPLCLSAVGGEDCGLIADVTVAHGNVVLVDDGVRVAEPLPPVPEPRTTVVCEGECEPVRLPVPDRRFTPLLSRPDVTFAESLPGLDRCGGPASAASLLQRDPSRATAQVALAVPGRDERWTACRDLLACGPDDRSFVVEMEEDRRAQLRFGDDRLGEAARAGTAFEAHYRVGCGPAGNVGAETIVQVALRGRREDVVVRVRNPLAAVGGTAPESLADAKLRIPVAFRARRERAVTADDYAELAARAAGPRVQRAAASLVWTGSWYEADVALDRRGGAEDSGCGCGCGCARGSRTGRGPGGGGGAGAGCGCGCDDRCDPDDVEASVDGALAGVRRMGHDVRVVQAELVPVDLELTVCVRPDHLRAHVKAALLDELSDRVLADGRLGFFHPDRWTFGDALYVSSILAAAHAVPGVESAEVTRLRRQDEVDRGERAGGVLRTGRREVVLLSADRVRPRRGLLDVVTRGGR